jgi:flagellar biosynthesis/type III secretory pathway chaperone
VQAEAHKTQLKATLEELLRLHAEEALALRRLARDELDALTDRKLSLWEQLRAICVECPPGPDERDALERIRRAALHNQILLHHARDAVRTILQSASGQPLSSPSNRPSAVQDGLRVDFRG